jgi:pimeloyl-ACP methyl ester carboxylesterase
MAAPNGPLAQLVTVTATDGLLLPALYFQPLAPTKRVVIWLHGMGSSGVIYSTDHTNAIAQALIDRGVAFLAMQNRGAGMLQRVKYFDEAGEKQKRLQGTSHELIADCVYDIDGAVAFARGSGHSDLYLGGHSTGANKIALYNYLKPDNPFAGYVIYGAGDDTGLYYEEFGPERFDAVRAEAQKQIANGHGADLATLVVYGEQDEYAKPSPAVALEIFKQHVADGTKFTYELIPGADHGCYQHEPELSKVIADWVGER